ncbi:MAG: helix-turn-helix domain-containing protein [Pseudomonadota bacterium]
MTTSPVHVLTILNIGFSIGSAVILLIAYLFFLDRMQKTTAGKLACASLLLALIGLQFYHLSWLLTGSGDLFGQRGYGLLLLAAPPTFYFFSRELLLPEGPRSAWQLLNLVPLALGAVLPVGIVLPVALTIGALYSIWFARFVYGMRRNVRRFRFEMFFFAFFALIAVLVLALFALVPYLDEDVFYLAYANFTGLSFLLIVAALVVFPEIVEDIAEVARITYAKSTLGELDVEAKARELENAMLDERLYQNEDLNLRMAAEAVDLSGHQLSELINTHFGMGFSRYVREHRIRAAKKLLVEDREASILSISMATGFRSQSNFYAAFKDIAGMSPGQYRDAPD